MPLLWGVACGTMMAAEAGHNITVKVAVDSTNDYKNIAGCSDKSKVQTRQLKVTLDNRDKEPVDKVAVKWTIYSHTMDGHKLATVKQGTQETKLAGFQTLTVNSSKVTIKGTPEHTVVTKKTTKSKTQVSSKKIPGSGEEYYGYSVAVYVGATLIDEVCSQPSLKRGN